MHDFKLRTQIGYPNEAPPHRPPYQAMSQTLCPRQPEDRFNDVINEESSGDGRKRVRDESHGSSGVDEGAQTRPKLRREPALISRQITD